MSQERDSGCFGKNTQGVYFENNVRDCLKSVIHIVLQRVECFLMYMSSVERNIVIPCKEI